MTPLHVALRAGHQECVMALVESMDILVNTADSNGQTPLHVAAVMADDLSIPLLLAAGALTDVKDKKGKTPEEYSKKRWDLYESGCVGDWENDQFEKVEKVMGKGHWLKEIDGKRVWQEEVPSTNKSKASSPALELGGSGSDCKRTKRVAAIASCAFDEQGTSSMTSSAELEGAAVKSPASSLPSSHLCRGFSSRVRPCSPSDGTDTLKASGAASAIGAEGARHVPRSRKSKAVQKVNAGASSSAPAPQAASAFLMCFLCVSQYSSSY
jgi:hypothetical protein